MRDYRLLKTHLLENVDALTYPENVEKLTLESPATSVFTDFSTHRPLVIESNTTIDQAQTFMEQTHVKLQLVVDPLSKFVGTLTLADLVGERVGRIVGAGVRREDIAIKDVMTPRQQLLAIDFRELETARIGDVVATLRQEHNRHFLVLDHDTHLIRGIFSSSDLARRLHIPIDISNAPSFADICHVVYQSTH